MARQRVWWAGRSRSVSRQDVGARSPPHGRGEKGDVPHYRAHASALARREESVMRNVSFFKGRSGNDPPTRPALAFDLPVHELKSLREYVQSAEVQSPSRLQNPSAPCRNVAPFAARRTPAVKPLPHGQHDAARVTGASAGTDTKRGPQTLRHELNRD